LSVIAQIHLLYKQAVWNRRRQNNEASFKVIRVEQISASVHKSLVEDKAKNTA